MERISNLTVSADVFPHYKDLILDLDGPLLQGRERHYRCYADIVTSLGGIPIPLEPYWRSKRAGMDRRKLLTLSAVPHAYDAFLRAWLERIEHPDYLRWDQVQPGVRETLAQWRSEGRRMILATMRQNEANLRIQLGELQLAEFFAHIIQVGIEQAGRNKAGEVRRRVPDLAVGRTLWIGDTEVDFQAARELSLPVALLECGVRDRETLAALQPDYLETDLLALSRNRVAMA